MDKPDDPLEIIQKWSKKFRLSFSNRFFSLGNIL